MFQSEGEAAGSSSAADNSQDLDESQDNKDDKDVKKKKNRCAMCRKKVGLTGKLSLGQISYRFTKYQTECKSCHVSLGCGRDQVSLFCLIFTKTMFAIATIHYR